MRTPALVLIALATSAPVATDRPARAATTGHAIVRGTGSCEHPTALRFPPGKHATAVQAVVTRDEIGCYAFVAHAGQVFDLSMTDNSTENAAAVVFEPGWAEKKIEDFRYTDGSTLPGAGRNDVAQRVHATLPTTGRYLIVTGPARGDAAAYTMRIEIH